MNTEFLLKITAVIPFSDDLTGIAFALCLYLSPENDQSRLMSTCLDSSHRDAFLLTNFSFFLGQLVT